MAAISRPGPDTLAGLSKNPVAPAHNGAMARNEADERSPATSVPHVPLPPLPTPCTWVNLLAWVDTVNALASGCAPTMTVTSSGSSISVT